MTINTDGSIKSEVCIKSKRNETLAVARGSSSLDWGQEFSRSQSFPLLVLAMAGEVVIVGALDEDWYGAHEIDGSGYLREENAEKRICRCAYSRSGLGVEYIAPKREASHGSLVASPVVDIVAECIWRRGECGGITGTGFEGVKNCGKITEIFFFPLFFLPREKLKRK